MPGRTRSISIAYWFRYLLSTIDGGKKQCAHGSLGPTTRLFSSPYVHTCQATFVLRVMMVPSRPQMSSSRYPNDNLSRTQESGARRTEKPEAAIGSRRCGLDAPIADLRHPPRRRGPAGEGGVTFFFFFFFIGCDRSYFFWFLFPHFCHARGTGRIELRLMRGNKK